MKIQISLSKGQIVAGGVYASVKAVGPCVIKFKTLLDAIDYLDPARKDIHCTVLYSRNDKQASGETRSRNVYSGSISEFKWWAGHDNKGYLVAMLDSPDLQSAFRDWKELGYSFEFKSYDPHITLKTGITKVEAQDAIDTLNLAYFPRPFVMTFGPQEVQPLRD